MLVQPCAAAPSRQAGQRPIASPRQPNFTRQRCSQTAKCSSSKAMALSRGTLRSSERYWGATGSLVTPRYIHTATLLTNGQVLIAGGYNEPVAFSRVQNSTIRHWGHGHDWQPPQGTQFSHCDVAAQRQSACRRRRWAQASDCEQEIYDPARGAWKETGKLISARQWHTATLLPNGKVLVAGGQDSETSATPSIARNSTIRGPRSRQRPVA